MQFRRIGSFSPGLSSPRRPAERRSLSFSFFFLERGDGTRADRAGRRGSNVRRVLLRLVRPRRWLVWRPGRGSPAPTVLFAGVKLTRSVPLMRKYVFETPLVAARAVKRGEPRDARVPVRNDV